MTGEIAVREQLAKHDAAILSLIDEQEADGGDIAEAIAAQYLDATTVDDVLGGGDGTIAAQDIVGIPLALHGVRYMRSEYDGPGYAAIMDCVKVATGERVIVTIGARQAMIQLHKLVQLGALPVVVTITELGKAKNGRSAPLGLRAATP